MTIHEKAERCLKICDELETAMVAGDFDLALIIAVGDLWSGVEELPDAALYIRFVELIGARLIGGNLHGANLALRVVRLSMAEELGDEALFQSYLREGPKISLA